MYQSAIFDLDGTIVNSEAVTLTSLQHTMRDLGREYSFDELRFALSTTGADALKILRVDDIKGAFAMWNRHYLEYGETLAPFDNIEAVLRALSSTGIVTSETRDEMQMNFYRFGFDRYVQAVVSSDDTERHKPHPDPLRLCLDRLGCPPQKALFIGDSLFDMQCAQACGVDFGLALWGANTTNGFESATYIFNDPLDILRYFQ